MSFGLRLRNVELLPNSAGRGFPTLVGCAAVLLMLATPAVDLAAQGDKMREPAETNVSYPAEDGTELQGYLALPPGASADAADGQENATRYPAVIMVHEWWGLNYDIQLLADALAAEGFIVLAPDLLRGSLAKRVPGAILQMRRTPEEQIRGDLDAAFAYLQNHEQVNAAGIASTGFCFGGTQSMHLGTRNPDLAAVVTYYGSGPIQDPAELGVMDQNEPVLGVFGEEDGQIPLDEVEGFRSALAARDIDHTITVYPEVGHAFINAENYNAGGTPEEAWQQMVSFLRDNLFLEENR